MITIFTPTYNRAYIIGKLYRSLCRQTSDDFEWLIVDDGSTDDTETLIQTFIHEAKIRVTYIRQPNGGKHRAINRGVREARGELFFIVDSDDYLTDDAVAVIKEAYAPIRSDETFCGVCGCRYYPNGKRVGGDLSFDYLDCSALDFRLKYKISGDMAEVVRTEVMRLYPFPEFEGETFCPEALVWFRMAERYKMRYVNKPLYICEYLPDGLTSKIVKIRRDSPLASMSYYAEQASRSIPWKQKIKAGINFWRFARLDKQKDFKFHFPLKALTCIPGRLFRMWDGLR